jgi:ribonuclease HII
MGKRKNSSETPKVSKKKFRTIDTHPDGIGGSPWPSLIVPNSICIDECGCGSFMGPLTIGAVYLKPGFEGKGIHDSKKLKPHEREKISRELKADPNIVYHVEHISNQEMDEIGGLKYAWRLGCQRATDHLLEKLKLENIIPTSIILDGNKTFEHDLPITCIEKADSIYVAVSSAAILAKTERDALMVEFASNFVVLSIGPISDEFSEDARKQFQIILKDGKGYRHSVIHDNLIKSGIYTNLHRKSYNPLKSKLIPKVVSARMLEEMKQITI